MTEFIEQVFSTIFGNNVILATILISIVPIIEVKGAIPFSMSTSIWGNVALSSTQALLFSLLGSCLIVPILALIYLPIINALKRSKLFKKLALKIEAKVNRSKNKIENKAEKSNLNQQENFNENTVAESKEIKENENTLVTEKANKKPQQESSAVKNKTGNAEPKVSNLTVNSELTITTKNEESKKTTNIFKRSQPYNKTFFIKLISVFLFVCVPLPLTGVWTGTCVAVMLGLGFWWSCLAVILGNIVAGVLVTLVASIPGFDSIYIVYAVLVFIVMLLLYSLIKSLVAKKQKNKAN